MTVAFPALRPTKRNYQAGEFPVSRVTTQNGVTVRRLFASKRSRASLDLDFTNIPDADATAILTCYEAARGTFDNLTLPAEIAVGASTALAAQITEASSGLTWFFAEPPAIESVINGRSSVRVRLEATRNP